MKKEKQKQIVTIDEFDNTVSLYQLLPAGTGSGLKKLKIIIDSIHNSEIDNGLKPFSLIIAGKQAVRTHARCFIRAMGLEYPYEMPSNLLQTTPTEVFNFFHPTRWCDSYVISAISLLYPTTLKTLYEIITTGRFSVYNNIKKTTEVVPVFNPILLTTHRLDKVSDYFTEKIDHIVELDEYTDQQLELIVLQRLKYCQIDYQEEKVLQLIVEYGSKNLHQIIRLVKDAITIMLADSRTVLTVEDVKKVMGYR